MTAIRDFFDRHAVGRDRQIAANPIIAYEQVVRARMVYRLLDPHAGERILDVGCGNGRDLPIAPLARLPLCRPRLLPPA